MDEESREVVDVDSEEMVKQKPNEVEKEGKIEDHRREIME